MKKRIERYLTNNNDASHIRKTVDGRYDFHGDLDGVLTAVRDHTPFDSARKGSSSSSGRKSSRRSSPGGSVVGGIVHPAASRTPRVNASSTSKKTATFSESMFTKKNLSAYPNSASRNLFDDEEASSSTTKHVNDDDDDEYYSDEDDDVDDDDDDDYTANNIFMSPPPPPSRSGKKKRRSISRGKKANSTQKRHLRLTFNASRASIMETPKDTKQQQQRPAHRSPTAFNSVKTPDVNTMDMRGFTPLPNNAKHHHYEHNSNFSAEILESGLFSPGWPLGKDLVVDGPTSSGNAANNNVSMLTFADGVKTPHASDHPRMCIANVRFGFGHGSFERKVSSDRMQREVAISPVRAVIDRKRQSMFGSSSSDSKKQKTAATDGKLDTEFPCVTPSFSVTSSTTVTTHPLTVCSSEASVRTTLSLQELSKVRPIEMGSSLLHRTTNEIESNRNGNTNQKTASPDCCSGCTEVEPKLISQDTPSVADESGARASPPLSSPSNFDKVGCSSAALPSTRKMEASTPAEKFWSSVGGMMESFERGSSVLMMSPTSNSE